MWITCETRTNSNLYHCKYWHALAALAKLAKTSIKYKKLVFFRNVLARQKAPSFGLPRICVWECQFHSFPNYLTNFLSMFWNIWTRQTPFIDDWRQNALFSHPSNVWIVLFFLLHLLCLLFYASSSTSSFIFGYYISRDRISLSKCMSE